MGRDGGMKQFSLSRELMGAPITAQVIRLPEGLQIVIFGGTWPHIGAISVVSPQGTVTTQQFDHHKDGAVSGQWARMLSEMGYRPAVIIVGIHYDHLNREQIANVVKLTDNMLSELLCRLKGLDTEANQQ